MKKQQKVWLENDHHNAQMVGNIWTVIDFRQENIVANAQDLFAWRFKLISWRLWPWPSLLHTSVEDVRRKKDRPLHPWAPSNIFSSIHGEPSRAHTHTAHVSLVEHLGLRLPCHASATPTIDFNLFGHKNRPGREERWCSGNNNMCEISWHVFIVSPCHTLKHPPCHSGVPPAWIPSHEMLN